MYHEKIKIYRGFTLAEVLITLVIIGVIAAITVPSLINKTNNQEYVSKLKKAYSTLAQATNKIISEEGTSNNWAKSNENVYYLYKKHLLNARDCSNNEGCFEQGKYKRLDGYDTTDWGARTNIYKMVLSDGSQIMFDKVSEECDIETTNNVGSINYCIEIYLDVNGARKPNIVGRDVFLFVVKKNGLYPAGCDQDDLCSKDYKGYACACRILRENAMNY